MPTADALMALPFPDVEHRFGKKDTIFYALSLGMGRGFTDARILPFVYERDLRALPWMVSVFGNPNAPLRACGLDYSRSVHGEQEIRLHGTVPVEGEATLHSRVAGVVDRGPGKGAFVYVDREVRQDGVLIATIHQTIGFLGDGGIGSAGERRKSPAPVPDRKPDHVAEAAIPTDAALLYRLNGDMNPLHADPAAAAKLGFDRPILHGLCTFGYAGRAVLEAVCGFDESRIASLAARFSAPVYPGDTLRTEMWNADGGVTFRCLAQGRDRPVIDPGWCGLKS